MTVTDQTIAKKLGLVFKPVFYTPEMAEHILANHNTGNRKLKSSKVKQYVSYMRRGEWRLTHQGIAFYEDGTLADGQHRLKAVVISGIGQWFNVCEGLERDAMVHIDRGATRSDVDVIKFAGANKADNRKVAIMRCLVNEAYSQANDVNWCSRAFDSDLLLTLYDAFSEKIEWIASVEGACFSKAPAPVWSAFIAASYTEDIEKIERFAEIVTMTDVVGVHAHEQAASRLRDYLANKLKNSWTGRQGLFYRTCAALRYFLEGKRLQKIYDTRSNTFQFVQHVNIDFENLYREDDV